MEKKHFKELLKYSLLVPGVYLLIRAGRYLGMGAVTAGTFVGIIGTTMLFASSIIKVEKSVFCSTKTQAVKN